MNNKNLLPLIGALFVPHFFAALMMGIALPVLPLYLAELGAGYALIGVVISANPLGSFLGNFPAGTLLTRFGIRTAMISGLVMNLLFVGAIYFMVNLLAVGLSWFLAGLGISFYEMARFQFIAQAIENRIRGRSVSTMGGVSRMGRVVGPLIGGFVAETAGFRTTFLWMAACLAIMLLLTLLFVPGDLGGKTSEHRRAPFSKSLFRTFREHRYTFATAGLVVIIFQLVREARPVIFPLFGADVLGLDVVQIGILMSLGSTVDSLMFIPAGLLMDKLGRKWALIPSLFLQGLAYFLLPLTSTLQTIRADAALIGFGNGLSSGGVLTLGADMAPEENTTSFLAAWRMLGATGHFLGPNIVGIIAGALTLGPASLAVGLLGWIGALVYLRAVPETLRAEV